MAIVEKQRYTFFKYFEHYHLDKIKTTRFNQYLFLDYLDKITNEMGVLDKDNYDLFIEFMCVSICKDFDEGFSFKTLMHHIFYCYNLSHELSKLLKEFNKMAVQEVKDFVEEHGIFKD